jgi:hypothetical protein
MRGTVDEEYADYLKFNVTEDYKCTKNVQNKVMSGIVDEEYADMPGLIPIDAVDMPSIPRSCSRSCSCSE